MNMNGKNLSNPFSTGGGGSHFEAHVQASFVALMLTGGFAPCMPCWSITEIKLQGKFTGYDTDDLIVFVENPDNSQKRKMLGQIKHSISITEKDKVFGEVVQAAWNDFNNASLFDKNSDVIVLITGPLSATDIDDVRTILEWARHSPNAKEFIEKVELANFSSQSKQAKLQAFRTNLCNANKSSPVSDEQLFEFLKHFHLLGYDLDIKAGVTLSLLHSLIGQYSKENVHSLWTQLVDEVQSANKNAGTICVESLSEELRNAFKQRVYEVIPAELLINQTAINTDWSQHPNASSLVCANLLGAWDEKNEADIKILRSVIKEDYGVWIGKIREVLQHPSSPISLTNGLWQVIDRKVLWQTLGTKLFDDDLEHFKQCAISVLTERDPQFDLPVNDRYAAAIYQKVLSHSHRLRNGIAESLALFGNDSGVLINCSRNNRELIAVLAIREIFSNADWLLWGSLNNLLPILAEAAPKEFLDSVEKALQQVPNPFDELFLQEGDGFTGGNYLTGLLWALESLAWDETYLVRVCVILAELATHDPGGKWSNRPANSLVTILLPWLPQTTAPVTKRKVALQTLQKEFPIVTWKLLLSLLPNQHQVSMGTRKPSWRNTIPDNWEKGVSQQDYWELVSCCADLAISMVNNDIVKLTELVGHLDKLPAPAFEAVLAYLSSESICGKPEDERLVLWDKLTEFVLRHRRFSNADWALTSDLLSKIEVVATKLAPQNPLNLYRRLFGNRDYDTYEEKDNYEEQRQKLEARREQALKDILVGDGIDSVIDFVESVESAWRVGYSLGVIAEVHIDKTILPEFLETSNKNLAQLAGGYVSSKQYKHGWKWVDSLDKSDWTVAQIVQFLNYLPFSEETWNRSATLLGESEREYWSKANVNPYQADSDIGIAIDKLIEYGRPHAAISCLQGMVYKRYPFDKTRSVKALLAATSSTEPSNLVDVYHICEVIKILQNDPDTNEEDLFRIEWKYLPLLDSYHGTSPKLLENRLATQPEFFCEVMRLIYRSSKETETPIEPSEEEKSVATNAYRLLQKWKTPPGTQLDGSFSGEQFTNWLKRAKEICTESGHLDIALNHIGQVLFYCPPDPQGLWIDQAAADALNAKDAEIMRNGFRCAIFNSRGVHTVDPTGEAERQLAQKYRQQADEVENCSYQRFAATLRELAEDYDFDAGRIIADYKS